MINIGKIGSTITLHGMSFTKLYIDGIFMGTGYIKSGLPFKVKIDGLVGISIISNKILYPLVADYDDFYAIIQNEDEQQIIKK